MSSRAALVALCHHRWALRVLGELHALGGAKFVDLRRARAADSFYGALQSAGESTVHGLLMATLQFLGSASPEGSKGAMKESPPLL